MTLKATWKSFRKWLAGWWKTPAVQAELREELENAGDALQHGAKTVVADLAAHRGVGQALAHGAVVAAAEEAKNVREDHPATPAPP